MPTPAVQLTLRISFELWIALKADANANKVSLNEYVANVLQAQVDEIRNDEKST